MASEAATRLWSLLCTGVAELAGLVPHDEKRHARLPRLVPCIRPCPACPSIELRRVAAPVGQDILCCPTCGLVLRDARVVRRPDVSDVTRLESLTLEDDPVVVNDPRR